MLVLISFTALILFFLAGMNMLRKGLISLTYSKIEERLLMFTDHPLKAFLISIVFTGFLQSSSAFMVIVIGFVSAGVLPFKRTIPMILGTNIGSTFTTEFLAVKMDVFIWVLLICGLLFTVTRKYPLKQIGTSFLGLGIIFFCISGFSRLAVPLTQLKAGAGVLQHLHDSSWSALLIGIILTAIIHSSSVCVGILMSFMNEGVIGLEQAMSVVLGSNIGTCITAVMAAVSGGYAAKQTAYAHVLFNVLGVMIVFPILSGITGYVAQLSPEPAQQIAHFSLLFNVVTALLFLPLANVFYRFINMLIPAKN
ncbi:Na/Pi symporter [Bacillus atrophaeus]|uniref:Na/Pi symporter n=1 Tax=Bacillus atrophaeus TaxID=1452 RepID=UPI00227DEAD6|nr:Na/Pi symporter [Bacillus atrophaeus]MCY8836923.1 Na/Pi symporter [Bacillus atrophaeus]